MQRKHKIILVTSIVLMMVTGFVSIFFPKQSTAVQEVEEKKYPVKTIVAQSDAFVSYGEYGGFVQGKNQSVISSKINGRLIEMKKYDGDIVHKGDIIAVLNADELTQQVVNAQKIISSLEDTLHDTKKYYEQKVDESKDDDASKEAISSAKKLRSLQVQSVQNSIAEAQGNLQLAQSFAKETIVRAPFDGVIIRTFQESGQIVGPTTPLFEIADMSELQIELFVAQDVIRGLSVNAHVDVLTGDSKKTLVGTVTSVGKRAQSSAQQARVTVKIEEKTNVQLGQYVTVQLPRDVPYDDAVIIPEGAVIQKYDETFVFVVENDRAVMRKIDLGTIYDGKVAVNAGISSGERVVIEGMHTIRDQYFVKVYE